MSLILMTSAPLVRFDKTGTTCMTCGSMVSLPHRIPTGVEDGLVEDIGACECGQMYRIVTSRKNRKLNVTSRPISDGEFSDPLLEVVVWPGERLVMEDA